MELELFQEVEDRYNTSLETNDANKISDLLSDDWTLLEPGFGQISKQSFLNAIKNKALVHHQMRKKVESVKVYGNTAIVLTKGINKGVFKEKPFDAENWITNVYRKEGKEWLMINSHECPVSCE